MPTLNLFQFFLEGYQGVDTLLFLIFFLKIYFSFKAKKSLKFISDQ